MLIAFLLILLLFASNDTVERYTGTVVIWSTLCFALTELLSLLKCISSSYITISWIFIDWVLVGVVIFRVVCRGRKISSGILKL